MLSKVKMLAATLAMVAFAAVPAVAQDSGDVSAEGGDAVNLTGDATSGDATNDAEIDQEQQVNQDALISAGGSNGQGNSNNEIDQNNEQNADIEQCAETGDANTGGNLAVGGDANAGDSEYSGYFFDFFGFFSRLFS